MTMAQRKETITLLVVAGMRLQAALENWKDDHNQIRAQHTYNLSNPQIRSSTSISTALTILASSLAYHNSRARNLQRSARGLIDLIVAHFTPPKSTTARDWHVKCCLAKVEHELLSLHEDLTRAEEVQIHQLEQALHLQTDLLEMEQSENMAFIIKAVELADRAQRVLQDSTRIERGMENVDFEQWKFDTQHAVDLAGRCRASLSVHDRAINMLLWLISTIVGEVPRQRLMTEFFEPA